MKKVYDVEYVAKQSLLLKGIGKYCKCGCKRHIFSKNKSKVFYNSSCRRRYHDITNPNVKYFLNATLSLKIINEPQPHYNLYIYPMKKGGPRLAVEVFPENKKLWEICQSFARFRVKQIVEITA